MSLKFVCVLVASAACSYPGLPPVVGRDGGTEPASPFTFTPAHLDPTQLPTEVADLTISADGTIDTSALTIGGKSQAGFVQQGGYAVLYGGAITLDAHLTVTGTLPLIIAATGTLQVAGNLDLHAVGAQPGPGAARTGAGSVGAVETIGTGPNHNVSGGGGGSYATVGGSGGTTNAANDVAGVPGAVYAGANPLTPLIGGSPGGAGGGGSAAGRGGGGGGAIELSSQKAVSIGDVAINAGGGGGAGGGNNTQAGGGGGGGAGGEIVIEAPTITVAGFLAVAGGGGGGGGGSDPTVATPGGNGNDAAANTLAVTGGTRGNPNGGDGGDGDNTGAGGAAADNLQHAGGGGGGAGVIWLRYAAATPPTTTGAHFVPAAKTDSSLP